MRTPAQGQNHRSPGRQQIDHLRWGKQIEIIRGRYTESDLVW